MCFFPILHISKKKHEFLSCFYISNVRSRIILTCHSLCPAHLQILQCHSPSVCFLVHLWSLSDQNCCGGNQSKLLITWIILGQLCKWSKTYSLTSKKSLVIVSDNSFSQYTKMGLTETGYSRSYEQFKHVQLKQTQDFLHSYVTKLQ